MRHASPSQRQTTTERPQQRGASVSPLFARLTGLPRLLIHAGEAETLVDQIRAFVARARADGVDVTAAVYPDMVHVWHMMRTGTPEAQRALDEVGVFVRSAGS